MTCSIQQSHFLSRFECLGDRCEDTCCKGWGMQLTQETVDRYKQDAPELLEVVSSGEAEYIMKRDPETDYCVKFDAGWCGIHRDYGTDFLGDACHFFPRVTRRLGDRTVMTASLSCPEIVRLALMEEGAEFLSAASPHPNPLPQGEGTRERSGRCDEQALSLGRGLGEGDTRGYVDADSMRLPHSLKEYLPEGMDAKTAWAIHTAFLDAASAEQGTPERILMRLRSVASSMQMVGMDSWGAAVPFYLKSADARLPKPEENAADPFNLLNALQGLVGASRKTKRPRLEETLREMEQALAVTLDWERLTIHLSPESVPAWQAMREQWQNEWAAHFNPILSRWIHTQLSVALFPFAGFGETLADRVTILGVRLATVKLALMSAMSREGRGARGDEVKQSCISDEETVRIIQSLSRFLDHLADPALSMQIYTETGWIREARLRALLGDMA